MKSRIIGSSIVCALVISMVVLFNNCSGVSSTEKSSQATGCGESLSDKLRTPETIDETVKLIRALPKPLSLDCFVKALKPPLNVYAVDNTFSAQPSAGRSSPRIFIIINNKLTLSVVPGGVAANLLEISEYVSDTMSVKGEIDFPVMSNIPANYPYEHILPKIDTGSTVCRSCHTSESRYPVITTGTAYQSIIIRPDPFKRVDQQYLKNQAATCISEISAYRCAILQAVYITGQANDVAAFP